VTPLPETVPVRYSEEEAGYVSFRPVVRQTFGMHELLDMILSVTGKDVARVKQILRAGTIAFRSYRYWWASFDPNDADHCTLVVLESGGVAAREIAEIGRAAASARRWFARGTVWQLLLETATRLAPAYGGYSYARRADVYTRDLDPAEAAALAAQAERVAPRALRQFARSLADARRLLLLCPRRCATDSNIPAPKSKP
jgi:hypothetical protein